MAPAHSSEFKYRSWILLLHRMIWSVADSKNFDGLCITCVSSCQLMVVGTKTAHLSTRSHSKSVVISDTPQLRAWGSLEHELQVNQCANTSLCHPLPIRSYIYWHLFSFTEHSFIKKIIILKKREALSTPDFICRLNCFLIVASIYFKILYIYELLTLLIWYGKDIF